MNIDDNISRRQTLMDVNINDLQDSLTSTMSRKGLMGSNSYKIAGASHTGLVREVNEDSYAYAITPEEKYFLAIVADGIGGHDKGDEASQQCIKHILSAWRILEKEEISYRSIKKFLMTEIANVNSKIYNQNQLTQTETPMGTTLTMGVFMPSLFIFAHAGDSRCYRLRNKQLEQLTEDHTLVYELYKKKIISEQQIIGHPLSHIISRAIGTSDFVEVDIYKTKREIGDSYLFCSDGLTNHVDDDTIKDLLISSSNPVDVTKFCIDAALHGGGEDNISVVCVFD